MSKLGKSIVWLVIIILVIWFVASMSKSAGGNEIKIGAILPLTGDAASYGEAAQNVYSMAVGEINQAGGINGKQIKMIVEDGKCSGPDAASAAQKLVNVDQVQVIIGGFCSGESLAAEPITTAAKVLLFSAASSSPDLTGKSPFFVRDYPSDNTQGKVLANAAYNIKHWKNVVFMQEQTDYALGVYTAFNTSFAALGGKTTNEAFPSSTADFKSSLTKLRAEKPDALFIDTQTPVVAERVLKQMEELGWKVPLMLADATIGDTQTMANNAAALEGTLGAEFGTNPNNPTFQHLLTSYKIKFGADLPYQSYGQTEYDAVYILKDGLMAVGNDGTKLSDWMHTVKDWQGASGKITISPDGDPIAGHVLKVIKKGVDTLY